MPKLPTTTEAVTKLPTTTEAVTKLPLAVGADPEFTYVANNLRFSAQEVIEKFINKKFDKMSMGYRIGTHGNVGWDGHSATGEIRPKHSKNPLDVVENIGALLRVAHDCLPTVAMTTTSLWMSIGGHVHLESGNYNELPDTKRKAIHRAIASFAIPLFVGENPVNARIRLYGGSYGDIMQANINNTTFEFRPLTAEWITTPETAAATLAYLGVVWNQFMKHPTTISKYADVIFKTDRQARAIQECCVDENALFTQSAVKRIQEYVRTFEFYEMYKKECELAMNPAKMRKLKDAVNYDITVGWKFRNSRLHTKVPSKKILMDDKLFKTKLKETNLDKQRGYVHIFWNQENRNVEAVARAIGDRAIIHNWNLEHRYFFFELPKGINQPIAITGKRELIAGKELMQTKGDATLLINYAESAIDMAQRYREFSQTVIDLKTGKSYVDVQKSIMIGLPYEMRATGEHKSILKLIHNIEHNRYEPILIENIADLELPEVHATYGKGKIVEALAIEEANTATLPITPTTQDLHGTSPIQDSHNRESIRSTTNLNEDLDRSTEDNILGDEEVIQAIENVMNPAQYNNGSRDDIIAPPTTAQIEAILASQSMTGVV